MHVQLNARNRTCTFECNDKESTLHGGLRNGIALPYECSTGTCGTCKAKLIKGKLHEPWPEAPGHKYLKRDQGEFLMCQGVPRTDLVAEVAAFVYPMDPGVCVPQHLFGVLGAPRTLTRDVVLLEVEADKPVDFDAGQFVGVAVPTVAGYRGYSMVNFERRSRRLQFVIKRKPGGGVSEWIFDPASRVEGTVVDLFGPLGHATFVPGIGHNLLAIAGGTGIAGIMSILTRATQDRHFDQYTGHVFFGVRTAADAFFLEELNAFAAAAPGRLEIVVALSDEEVPASLQGRWPALAFEHGLVHQAAARRMKDKYANVRAYVAGPPPAVEAAIRTLIVEAKLTTNNILYDKFS